MIKDFLCQFSPTPLSNAAKLELDTPLNSKEVELALKQMKAGKSPGPDGFSAGYYKTYAKILVPFFVSAFNSFSHHAEPPRDLMTAHVVVIPKPGKDPSVVANYRPISLLNVDLKWYAKALANTSSGS